LGTSQIYGGLWEGLDNAALADVFTQASIVFVQGEVPAIQTLLVSHKAYTFSLSSLSRDTQHLVAHAIMQHHLPATEAACRYIQALYASLSPYIVPFDHPLPRVVQAAAEIGYNLELRRACEEDQLDAPRIHTLLMQSQDAGVQLDTSLLSAVLNRTLERLATQYARTPLELSLLQRLVDGVTLGQKTPLYINVWPLQNVYYTLLHTVYPSVRASAMHDDSATQVWMQHFRALGEALGMYIDQPC
jgi:hypothetical protein